MSKETSGVAIEIMRQEMTVTWAQIEAEEVVGLGQRMDMN